MNSKHPVIVAAILAGLCLALPHPGLAQDTSASSGQATDTSKLRWKLNQGESYTLNLSQKTTAKTEIDSRSNRVNSDVKIQFQWDIDNVDDDGVATIKQSIASIAVSVSDPEVPAQAVAFDTDSDQKPSRNSRDLLKQVKPLIGLEFVVSLSNRGELLNVELPEETEKRINELPNALRLKALFNQQGLTELLRSSTLVFPESLTEKKWQTDDLQSTPFGKLNRTVNYTLDDTSDSAWSIQSNISVSSETQTDEEIIASKTGDKGAKLIAFNGSGTLKFDPVSGRVVSSNSTSTAKTSAEYREKTIVTNVTSVVEMQLTPKQ
ncbi:MAG: DUF6263 family protein [Planctomycetota bacterium]